MVLCSSGWLLIFFIVNLDDYWQFSEVLGVLGGSWWFKGFLDGFEGS